MTRPLCIYHHPCYDGFTAAWSVRQALGEDVEFHATNYGREPPDVTGRDVIIVDFSYPRDVLLAMGNARTILILDHHKTAADDLAGLLRPTGDGYDPQALLLEAQARCMPFPLFAIFDMARSGAGIAWDYFNPGKTRPKIVDYVEDRDLWQFILPFSREISAALHSWGFDFGLWDMLAQQLDDPIDRRGQVLIGQALERRHHKDIDETLRSVTRRMIIGGISVPVANVPYAWASDAGNKLAQGEPFAACYVDTPQGRSFSLRSTDAGLDVSAIAKIYGGGGHRNASGFKMPPGWEGDADLAAAGEAA